MNAEKARLLTEPHDGHEPEVTCPGCPHPAEQDQDQDDLARALSKAARWLNVLADGGPDLRVNAHVKAAHEAAELAAEPSLEEFADVLICLVGTALHHGWTVADVADAVTLKTGYNTLRTWDQQPDGTWQHRAYSPAPQGARTEPPSGGKQR